MEGAMNTLKKLLRRKERYPSMSDEELQESLVEINRLSSVISSRSSQLVFAMAECPATGSSTDHRRKRICVMKINKRSGAIETERVVDLNCYLHLMHAMLEYTAGSESQTTPTDQLEVTSTGTFYYIKSETERATQGCGQEVAMSSTPDVLTASLFIDNIPESPLEEDDHNLRPVCCICMDSKADVILSCLHMYCGGCVDSWRGSTNTNKDRCPQCREKMHGPDDLWVMAEKPTDADFSEYVTDCGLLPPD